MPSVMTSRQAAELDHAFERNGWNTEEIKKLSQGEILGKFRDILLGYYETKPIDNLIDLSARPYCPKGELAGQDIWIWNYHNKGGKWLFNPNEIKLDLFEPEESKDPLEDSWNLPKKLATLNFLNANVLDFLMKNPKFFPEEWKGKRIFFWGTIYGMSAADTIRYIFWDKDNNCPKWYYQCLNAGLDWIQAEADNEEEEMPNFLVSKL